MQSPDSNTNSNLANFVNNRRIYLIDVSSMFFRAFYAIRPLTAPNGTPVNAVYGFLSMLVKLLKDERPDHLVFCYDRKEPSFRKDMYADYKANRTEMPEDLGKQIPYIKKLADVLGIPAFEISPYEADDLIGTMSVIGLKNNCEVVIVSGDKDFGQLIKPGVVLYDTMKDVKYDSAAVKEKWGVAPEQFIDYLALVGDTSDNIPGVAGIGPKGAIKLLEQFGSLRGIYDQIDSVESKSIKEKLLASKENAFLSQKLVTISCDVPMSDDLSAYHMRPVQKDQLQQLLQELNFKNFDKALLGEGGVFSAVTSSGALQSASPSLNSVRPTGLQLFQVTESIVPSEVKWQETSWNDFAKLAVDEFWALNFQSGILLASQENFVLLESIGDEQKHFLRGKKICGYDLKSFLRKSNWSSFIVNGTFAWDSMLAAYAYKAEDWISSEKAFKKFLNVELPEIAKPETVLDAHLFLRKTLELKLNQEHGRSVFQDLDMAVAPVLLKMEILGIRLDDAELGIQSTLLESEIKTLEREIKDLSGQDFNVASPKQLGNVLFEKMGLPSGKKTKTGFSTDNEVLEAIDHPIAKKVLQFRELSKLKSTYVDALPAIMNKQDHRVHTSFNQAVTTTGRLSSTDPNLQNIPIRTLRGQRVRKCFIAEPGKALLSADYSQIELRILAHISEDPGLCRAFADDLDIHSATASEVFSTGLKDVTSEQRRVAKAVNFGIAYGQGAFGLAETLGIPRSEAQGIIKRYFEKFKGVQDYIEGTIKSAHEKGYVETLFGRRRYIEELSAKIPALKKFGERAAINAPIQGTAADLVKKAMIEIDKKIDLPMLLQVHDELVFEGKEEDLQGHAAEIVSIMESVMKLKVPLKVNFGIGKNWDDAH